MHCHLKAVDDLNDDDHTNSLIGKKYKMSFIQSVRSSNINYS